MLHHLTLFTVPRKHHSMLTEESADEKLLADDSITLTTSQALKGEATDLDKNSPSSCLPVSVEASTGSPVDPGGSIEILTEPVHQRSAVVYVPPKRLIQEI
ncbi:hypothetical protein pdam_00007036 [Pocillopora damicornis]|uniref:Uncharacterized protein n=1 Tax=Pocillopora damicornis TaxID=46731 RepID=A0A3M6T938_POCDA|nr:hypothetical protein pdam_00007036 [Pocillopora damicornis]